MGAQVRLVGATEVCECPQGSDTTSALLGLLLRRKEPSLTSLGRAVQNCSSQRRRQPLHDAQVLSEPFQLRLLPGHAMSARLLPTPPVFYQHILEIAHSTPSTAISAR